MWQSREHQESFLKAGVAESSITYPASIGNNDMTAGIPEWKFGIRPPTALTS
jgi:hypothetical protein